MLFASYSMGQYRPKPVECSKPGLGLKVTFPPTWKVIDTHDGVTCQAWSFDPSRRVVAVIVPLNGAEIAVLAAPPSISSIDDWLSSDERWIERQQTKLIRRERIVTRGFGEVEISTVRWAENPDISGITAYFMLGGRPVKACLFYRGRRNQAVFERAFAEVLNSLEVSAK
jgi:hypothetical protein